MISARPALRAIFAAAILVSGGYSVALAQRAMVAAPDGASPAAPKVKVEKRAYDIAKLVGAPALAPEAYRGRTIWLQRCAYCHDGVGQPSYKTLGPWIGAETITTLTEEGARAFIASGTEDMPGFGHTLKPAQMNDLIAFIKTLGPETKPTALQLADGKGAAPAPAGGNGD